MQNLTSTGADFTTYVYRFPPAGGNPAFWLPAPPSEAKLAVTAVGTAGTTSVGDGAGFERLSIRASPNPALQRATLRFSLPSRGELRLTILDVSGRVVRRLAHDFLEAGAYRVPWDGLDDSRGRCAAGLYFCRVEHAGASAVGNIILLSGRP